MLKNFSLLYIENSLDKIYDASQFFEDKFAEVFVCTNIEEVTKTFKEFFVDIIVCNVDIEDKSLIKFLQLVKKNAPDLPMVMLSKNSEIKVVKYDLLLPVDMPFTEIYKSVEELAENIAKFSNINRSKVTQKTEEKSPKIEEAIEQYFIYILEGLTTCDQPKLRDRIMDYFIMKPFLITALNHFKSLDGSFEDDNIKQAKWRMQKASELWQVMIRKTSASIETLYEEVFLKKHIEYLRLYEENNQLLDEMTKSRSELDTINRQLDIVKEEIKTLRGDAREEKISFSKRLNAKSVDLVHNLANMKERLNVIIDSKKAIYDAHIVEFTEVFRERVEVIRADLARVLGLMAYRLDKAIWQKAKTSISIKNFFYESRIIGFFSSKTFLEYFVKNIDKDKASTAQKTLVKYLDEYNKKNRIKIALLGKSINETTMLKAQIERIDPIVEIMQFTNIEALISKHKIVPFYAIITSFDLLGGKNAADFFVEFHKTFADEKDQIFIVSLDSQNDKNETFKAKDVGIKNFIYSSMSQDKLTSKLMEIL